MTLRRPAFLAVLVLALALAGCGDDGDGGKAPAPVSPSATLTTPAALKLPPLARVPLRDGDLLFSGKAAYGTHGSFRLEGRYRVRFEQFDPEDANKDFSGEPPFIAGLRPAKSSAPGSKLFSAARPSGELEITRRGSYALDVTSGKFPYAVRFTPLR